MKYSILTNSVATEVLTVPDGFTIQDCVHASLVGNYLSVPDDVEVGSILGTDGAWSPHVPPVYPDPTPEELEELEAQAAAKRAMYNPKPDPTSAP